MMRKICSKCESELPISEFYRNRRSKDGYGTYCKKCFREYYKGYYKKNKDKWDTYREDWNAQNPGKKAKIDAEWRERNRETERDRQRRIYEEKKLEKERRNES